MVDLLGIGRYTVRTWGAVQAAHYIDELERLCQTLADRPSLGRRCDEAGAGLRRLEHESHVVFYRPERGGVVIWRILHQRMLPDSYIGDKSDVDE